MATKSTFEADPFKPDLMLVDINGLGYAAMYTPMGALEFEGKPTGGIHGALASLFLAMEVRPGTVPFVLWDCRANWRHELDPNYKGNRTSTEEKVRIKESYRRQVPIIQWMLRLLGIPQISCGEAEADDLAGVICRNLHSSWLMEMFTRDTDWYQGLKDNYRWYSPLSGRRVSLADLMNPATDLRDGFFRSAQEFIEFSALSGDDSDAIEGLPGVGYGTLRKLVHPHASLQEFWAACDSGTLPIKGVKMTDLASARARDIYAHNIKLMDWNLAPPLRHDLLSITKGEPDWAAFEDLAREHGLVKMPARAKAAMESWKDGWGPAWEAVEAALHHTRMQPVPKPSAVLAEEPAEALA